MVRDIDEATTRAPGRPRSEKLRRAVLDAAFQLERQYGYSAVTYQQIANVAHVGRQTIYRWWPTKSDLYFELITSLVTLSAKSIDIEHISLEAYLCELFKVIREQTGTSLLGLFMEGQSNPELLGRVRKALTGRRSLAATVIERFASERQQQFVVPLSIVIDMILGAMWYRMLMEHDSLDNSFAHELTLAAEKLLGENLLDVYEDIQ
jgi:AcrR family transcriptional regulator